MDNFNLKENFMKKIIFGLLLFGSVSFATPMFPGTCALQTSTVFSATTTDSLALAASALRRCLTITNESGSSVLYVNFGSADDSNGLQIPAKGTQQFYPVPGNSIYMHSSAGIVDGLIYYGK